VTTRDKLEIRTPDGVADAWTYKPEGKGPSPAIVFYPDAGGVRPTMHQMAERLASLGYPVLLPNVFYRAGEFAPFDMKTVFSVPEERARIMNLIQSLDPASAMRDAKAYMDAILSQPGVAGDHVGCVGYCMGGRLAFITAGTYPERVAASASIHPGGLVTDKPDSPHANAPKIRAHIYLGVADNDGSCTPEHQGALASSLGAAHVAYQLELYRGASHGFAVPDMPVYDKAAAERHWERLAALFTRALPRGA
jgi:carboxymethylenebutenolidase